MEQSRYVTSGAYDPGERAIAARLGQEYAPWWVVWWGVGSRRYWAVPTWPGAPVSIVDGRTPDDLAAVMRRVEVGAVPARTPAGAWSGS